jgi:dipeptidase
MQRNLVLIKQLSRFLNKMCDTIVCLKNSTSDGLVIFAKNSDRDPDEVHTICYLPRTVYKENEIVHCQYIDIPQVKETYAVILSKPAWLKIGCEMGANEYGLVMGNEAVFSKEIFYYTQLLYYC